jgi:photosystem II stability/assembly factor-like uncharacterized protein
VKMMHKAFIIALIAGLIFVLFAFSWNENRIQAAAFPAGETAQTLSAPTGEPVLTVIPAPRQYLPLILNNPPTPTNTPYPTPVYPLKIIPIGPNGVTITSVLIDPLHQNIVYAGAYGWGVLKSVDSGSTWFKSGNGMPGNAAIQSLGLIPSSPNVIFAGTNGDGLYRSANYGDTWTKVGSGFGTNAVYGITPDLNRPKTVYIVTRITEVSVCGGYRGAFYRSEDWGLTWALLRYGDIEGTCQDYWYDVDVNPWDSNIVYLSYHQHGPYRSTDNAVSFYPLRTGIDFTLHNGAWIMETRSIAIDTLSRRMYSGFWDPTYVYYSDNMGEQWFKSNFSSSGILKISLGPLYPSQQRVFLATYASGVAFSNDRGGTWITRTFQNPQNIVYDIAISNTDPQRWYAGTQFTGLYVSTNYGASWSPAGTGITASSIAGLTTSPQLPGKTIAAVYGQGVMVSSDDGQNWETLNTGLDSSNVTSIYDLNGQLYALADTGVYQYTDSGWQNLNMPQVTLPNLEAYLDYSSKTFPIEKQLVGEMLQSHQKKLPSLQKSGILAGNTPATRLASCMGQLYAGTAGDGLWVRDGNQWQQLGFAGQMIADIAFSPEGNQVLVIVCTTEENCLIYALSEQGWLETSDGLSNTQVNDLLTTPDGELYAAASGGIYRFERSTKQWQNLLIIEGSLTAIASSEDGHLLAATGPGSAWYSLDGGDHWQSVDGLEPTLTYTSALFTPDGFLILGSDAGGAFKLELFKP